MSNSGAAINKDPEASARSEASFGKHLVGEKSSCAMTFSGRVEISFPHRNLPFTLSKVPIYCQVSKQRTSIKWNQPGLTSDPSVQ